MEVGQNCPAEDIAKRAAHRNRGAKECHNTSARLQREKIGQNGRRGRSVAALTNADQYAGRKKHGKSNRQPRRRRGETPEDHCRSDNQPARKAVREPTENGRTEHIRDQKRAAERSADCHRIHIRGRKKSGPNPRFDSGENLPVDVIEHVDGKE